MGKVKILDSIPIDPPKSSSSSGGIYAINVYQEPYEWVCAQAEKRNMSRVRFMSLLIKKIMEEEK